MSKQINSVLQGRIETILEAFEERKKLPKGLDKISTDAKTGSLETRSDAKSGTASGPDGIFTVSEKGKIVHSEPIDLDKKK